MKTYLRQVCATIFLVCFSVVNLQVADAQPIPYRCATQEIDLLPKSKTLRPTNIFLNQSGTVDTTTIYTIPVVFVVYHLGESVGTGSNISDANLQAQLDHLNRNFSGQRTDYYGLDAKIRFAFARRSPSCNSSSGIVRVDARSVPGYQQQGVSPDDRTKDLQLQSLVPDYIGTGNDRFITVRIIHMANGGWAAYGGIYISAYFMTTDNSLLTHEVGHICGLAHTFAGSEAYNNYSCPFNENPKFDGDGVADTDPHKRAEPNNSCSSASEQQINSCTGR